MTSSGPSRPEVGDIPKALSSALPARLSSYRGSIPACHHGPRNVTLLCHDIQTVVTFTGKEDEPFNELKSLYFHGASLDPCGFWGPLVDSLLPEGSKAVPVTGSRSRGKADKEHRIAVQCTVIIMHL